MEQKVISVSRRTDIPAFYSRWFLNRVKAGFCHWINPFGGQVYRISLRPEDCLALVFWTRNPKPLLPHLDLLRREGYSFYFHFTINGYQKALESNNPPVRDAISTFRSLSELISPDFTLWRYDPILLSELTTTSYHHERFDSLSRQLEGFTKRCYFSFVDFYGKTERSLKRVEREHNLVFKRPSLDKQRQLAHQLRDIAATRGITLYSCCGSGLVGDGIEMAHCIGLDLVAKLRPEANLHLKNTPTRQDCGCVETADIGAYDTCGFGCAYCYATNSRTAALARMRTHDPEDTVLWRPASMAGIDLVSREQAGPKKKSLSTADVSAQRPLF